MKHQFRIAAFLLPLILAVQCSPSRSAIMDKLQYAYGPKDAWLKPLIIRFHRDVSFLEETGKSGSIQALVSGKTTMIQFNNDNSLTLKKAEEHPASLHGNLQWWTIGRGLYVKDTATGRLNHIIISNDGNSRIDLATLIDPTRQLFLVQMNCYPRDGYIALYDFSQDKITYRSKRFNGRLCVLGYNKILLCSYNNQGMDWKYTDPYLKTFSRSPLTRTLSRLQLKVYPFDKNMSIEHRIILGTAKKKKPSYIDYDSFIVRWDTDEKNVKVTKIETEQYCGFSGQCGFGGETMLSDDGNWVRIKAHVTTNSYDNDEVFIYGLDHKLPAGITPPQRCGLYTADRCLGTFMNHEKWGPCYVEHFKGSFLVFKLKGAPSPKEQ